MFSIKVEPEENLTWEERDDERIVQEDTATIEGTGVNDITLQVTVKEEECEVFYEESEHEVVTSSNMENSYQEEEGCEVSSVHQVNEHQMQPFITHVTSETSSSDKPGPSTSPSELGTDGDCLIQGDSPQQVQGHTYGEHQGEEHQMQPFVTHLMSGTSSSDKPGPSTSPSELGTDGDRLIQGDSPQQLQGLIYGGQKSNWSKVLRGEAEGTNEHGVDIGKNQCLLTERTAGSWHRTENIAIQPQTGQNFCLEDSLNQQNERNQHQILLSNGNNMLCLNKSCEMTGIGENRSNCHVSELFLREKDCQVYAMVQTGEKTFNCKFCGQTFYDRQNCKSHEIIHTGEKPFRCQYCFKTFSQKLPLKRHEMIHTGEKPYECQFCGKAFIQKMHCKTHEMMHTGEKPFKCEFCEKTFNWKQSCKVHEKIHSSEKPFKCQYCERAFYSKQNCRNHEITHTGEKSFKCQYCEKAFYQKHRLEKHKMIHTGEKHVKCQFCEESFTGRRECRTHEMKIHTGEKPFKCQFCEKAFIWKHNCKKHEGTHTEEKPFKCQFCERAFKQNYQLQGHEMIHTGEKRFKCQFCEKSFIWKHNCKTHEGIHTGHKPFKCQYCEKAFNRKYRLKRHEMNHTSEKPVIPVL